MKLIKENYKVNKSSLFKSINDTNCFEVQENVNKTFTIFNLKGSNPTRELDQVSLNEVYNYWNRFNDKAIINGNLYKLEA